MTTREQADLAEKILIERFNYIKVMDTENFVQLRPPFGAPITTLPITIIRGGRRAGTAFIVDLQGRTHLVQIKNANLLADFLRDVTPYLSDSPAL